MPSTACTQCHSAKVKCVRDQSSLLADLTGVPCNRCTRLKLKCEPHRSRQGQGKKRRRKQRDDASNSTSASSAAAVRQRVGSPSASPAPSNQDEPAEDALHRCVTRTDSALRRPNHYGIRYLVRSWVSYAFTRRSFSLLMKASSLASRVGISMDSILCGGDAASGLDGGPMAFLPSVMLTRANQQIVAGNRLRWSELPHGLLAACGCNTLGADDLSHLGNRYLFVREMNRGKSRYLVSPAFERDIVPWSTIQAAWVMNRCEVTSLFLTPEARATYSRALIHQLTLHPSPGAAPRPSKCATSIRVQGWAGQQVGGAGSSALGVVVPVDVISCLEILDLDRAFYYCEYVNRTERNGGKAGPASTSAAASALALLAAGSSSSGTVAAPSNPFDPTRQVAAVLPQHVQSAPPTDLLDLSEMELGELDDLMDLLG